MEIYIPTILNLTSDINIDSDVTKPSHQLPNYNYSINDFTSDFNIMYKEVLQCLQYKYDEKLSKFIFKLSNDTQTLISSINLINHYTTLSLNQNDRQNINKHDIVIQILYELLHNRNYLCRIILFIIYHLFFLMIQIIVKHLQI